MPNGHAQREGGLPIRRKEGAIFGRMLVNIHLQMEGAFDLIGCAFEIHHQPILMGVGHGKAVCLREIDDRLVVSLRGSKLLSELSDTQIVPVIGALGI